MAAKQTNTLIIGASISGLASAASLQKQNIEYIIIENKTGQLRHGSTIIAACIYTPIKGFQSNRSNQGDS